MSAVTRARGIAAVATAALAAATAAGCGSSHASSASAPSSPGTTQTKAAAPGGAKQQTAPAGISDTLHCVDVPHALARRILHGVLLDGARLNRVEAVASPKARGYYFVSSTVSGGGASNKSLATWAASGLASADHVYAVDAFAALISTYGDAAEVDPDLNIHERAAYQSRICAGGPHATHGAPAPQSGIGNAPATG